MVPMMKTDWASCKIGKSIGEDGGPAHQILEVPGRSKEVLAPTVRLGYAAFSRSGAVVQGSGDSGFHIQTRLSIRG
jgi:hypothetical protein